MPQRDSVHSMLLQAVMSVSTRVSREGHLAVTVRVRQHSKGEGSAYDSEGHSTLRR